LQRAQAKAMLAEWERRFPGRTETIFRSLSNVSPSHLLDRELFEFGAIQPPPGPRRATTIAKGRIATEAQ
jgi:tRNA 2-thiocytidine biosynthesis protein TtcA